MRGFLKFEVVMLLCNLCRRVSLPMVTHDVLVSLFFPLGRGRSVGRLGLAGHQESRKRAKLETSHEHRLSVDPAMLLGSVLKRRPAPCSALAYWHEQSMSYPIE
jgi:hypothetical protein